MQSKSNQVSCYMEALNVAYRKDLKRVKRKRTKAIPFHPVVVLRRNGSDVSVRRVSL